MTTRQLRRLLWGTAASLTLAAGAAVAWPFLTPPIPEDHVLATDHDDGLLQVSDADRAMQSQLPARDKFLALAERPLRQQLFDPPPEPEPAPPPPPALPGVELISTVIRSSGPPSAWVREAATGNTARRVVVGDVLGPNDNPATITAIEPDRLVVEHHGEIKPIERASESNGGRR